MMKEKDQLDEHILNSIRKTPGVSISSIIKPFLLEKSETALRQRIRALELRQLIRIERTKKESRLYRNPGPEAKKDV